MELHNTPAENCSGYFVMHPNRRFNNLYSLLRVELLGACFEDLRGDAASGIDEVTKEQYAEDLEANLADLEARMRRLAYRPQAVRRGFHPPPRQRQPRPPR